MNAEYDPVANAILENSDQPVVDVNVVELQKSLDGQGRHPTTMEVSELRYRRLFEAARDGILILDGLTSRITDSNPFMTELLGYSHEELLGKQLADIGLFKDRESAHEAMVEVQRNSFIRYDNLPVTTKSYQRRDVEFVSNVYVEDGTKVIQCHIRDITERLHAESEQKRLAAIVSSSHDLIYSKDLDGIIATWNQAGERLYGYTADEIIGQPFSKFVPDTHAAEYDRIMTRLSNGEIIEPFDTVSTRKDGSTVEVNTRISPLKDAEGRVTGGSVITRDISEQCALSARLVRAQARSQRLVESNVIGVLIAHVDGRIVEANEAILDMLGYTQDDLDAGRLRWDALTPLEFARLDIEAIAQIQKTGRCIPFQKEYIRKDGSRVPILIGAASLDYADEMVAWVVDMTRIQEHELEIIGLNDRLRRAMAETHHRVKNNLQMIAAMVDIQVMEGTETLPTSAMKRLGTQVNALVGLHDLLTDESRNDIEARSLDVFQVLGKLLPLLRVAAGAMDIAFHGDHALISINQAASLCLIANEIITNAIKHGGGTVDIAFRVNDSEAVLTVDDNGHGFPINFNPETMSNHGLEMACHLVRLDLSGSIAFETRAEGGGRVSVTMPRFAQTLNAGEHTIAYSALSAPSFQT